MSWGRKGGDEPPPPPPSGNCPQGGDHDWYADGHDDVCRKCQTRVTAR